MRWGDGEGGVQLWEQTHLELVAKILFPFLSNGSHLTAFIHASLSYLHLMGIQSYVLCKFLFSIYWFYKYYLMSQQQWFDQPKTTMIWKLRLDFDVYTSFSQVILKKALHDSDFLPPLVSHVFKNKMSHSYGNWCMYQMKSFIWICS